MARDQRGKPEGREPPWFGARDTQELNARLLDLPFPVAHAVEAVLAERNAEGRVEGVLSAFLCMTRFLALVGLAWYLKEDQRDTLVDERIRGTLAGVMSDGKWLSLLEDGLRPYLRTPSRAFIPGLVTFWFHRESGNLTQRAREFNKWVQLRNDKAHPGRSKELPPPEVFAARLWKRLEKGLAGMSVLTQYDLLQPLEVSTRHNVIQSARFFGGPSRNFRVRENLAIPLASDAVEPRESVLFLRKSDPQWQASLSPFLRVGEAGDLQLLNQVGTRAGKAVAEYVSAEQGSLATVVDEGHEAASLLGDLRSLLAMLGGNDRSAVLPTLRGSLVGGRSYPVVLLERWARAWVRDGFRYEYILKLDKETDLLQLIDTPSAWGDDLSEGLEAYLLLAALHYRLSWRYWSDRCRKNRMAAAQALAILTAEDANRHHRPRLRALYTLQLADRDLLNLILKQDPSTSRDTTLVREWVLSGRAKSYLRYLAARGGPYPLPHYAAEVLSEIRPTGAGGIDLPLDPRVPYTGEEDESTP